MKPEHDKYALARAMGVPARDAAISVGYAAAGAAVTASRLESRADVKKAIANYRRGAKSSTSDAESDTEERAKTYLKPRYDSPLALLEDLMNNPKAPDSVRVESAKLALPYRHGKVAEGGKKEKAADEAKKGAKEGKFKTKVGPGRPSARPSLN